LLCAPDEASGAQKPLRVGVPLNRCAWVTPVRVVKEVEEFTSKIQVVLLLEGEVFGKGNVHVPQSWANNNAAAGIAYLEPTRVQECVYIKPIVNRFRTRHVHSAHAVRADCGVETIAQVGHKRS